jgi:hypothetical protein
MEKQVENEDFNLSFNFVEGDSPSVVGEGRIPRGIYQFKTIRVYTDVARNGKTPLLKFEHQIVKALVLQEDGSYVEDANLVGRVIKNTQTLPTGDNAEIDGYRRNDILGIMVGHNKLTREQAKNAAGQQLQLTKATFLNQSGQCMHDPPKPGTDDFPVTKYLDGTIAEKIVTGALKPNWPQDRATRKNNANAAAGGPSTGAGSLLGAQTGLPAGGAAGGGFGGLPGAQNNAGGAPSPEGAVQSFGGGGGAPAAGGWS